MSSRATFSAALLTLGLVACSPDEADVLPEDMREENLPAVDTYQETDSDVDFKSVDVGDDAVRVPVDEATDSTGM
ncbi:hypothetical protein [Novosphingobium sp. M1R2S20]|uniref:Secreted protein n=1 Tax=Novosphingobium rhizovicinum TaxID=3228928 RepID=A0ABV3R9J2_9SPHN